MNLQHWNNGYSTNSEWRNKWKTQLTNETQLTVALRQMWTSTEQGPDLAGILRPAGNGLLQDFRPHSFVLSLRWWLVEGEFIFFHEQIFIEHPLWNRHWPECLLRSWETMRGFGPFHSMSGPWRVLGHPWQPPVHSGLQPGEAEELRPPRQTSRVHQGPLSWWVGTST